MDNYSNKLIKKRVSNDYVMSDAVIVIKMGFTAMQRNVVWGLCLCVLWVCTSGTISIQCETISDHLTISWFSFTVKNDTVIFSLSMYKK